MQSVYDKFNDFQRQSQSQRDIIRTEDLNKQIIRLEQIKADNEFQKTLSQKYDLDHFIKVYKLAVKQIGRMKMQFTKPSLVKERLADIFRNQKQQNSLQGIFEKSSQIKSSEIEIPSFKNSKVKENVIDQPNRSDDLGSPGLRNFFQKKEAQLMNRGTSANFKSVLQKQSNNSFGKSNNNNRSVSRQQPSGASHSSASSFNKKNSKQLQLKKILQQNKKIKQEYQKRLKRQMQLNEFEKKLLKEEKNRYMQKIEEMQSELESIYRANYKLKEQVEIKQKQLLKQKTSFEDSSFKNLDEKGNLHSNQHDYYQPYVMKTKHNDLKRLNNKCHSQIDMCSSERSKNDFFMDNQNEKNNNNIPKVTVNQNNQNHSVDILGNQLEKQLKELQKQRSRENNSRVSSKKWSRQYNPDKYQQKASQKQKDKQDLLRVLRENDEEEFKPKNQQNNLINKGPQNPFQKTQNNTVSRQFQGHSAKFMEPQENFYPLPDLNGPYPPNYNNFPRKVQDESIEYRPSSNYEFSRTVNRDYSIGSNLSNCDTFQMTKTYLNMSQNEQQSLTNKYIDSKTSTRNKVAFFKDSLILIKNDTFELAFKRSALVETKDRVRIIFFIKNKTNYPLQIIFKYQYDTGYFKIKVNEKMGTVLPQSQAREDIEVYAYSTIDLNQVVDILLQVNSQKYGLWMPILWIEFSQNENFNMASKNEQITVIPDRQFKSYDTAKTIIPLTFGGMDATSQWAYLYGKSKFGPCYIKLIWEMNQLKIQTNAKWIDLLAFVMHHVK